MHIPTQRNDNGGRVRNDHYRFQTLTGYKIGRWQFQRQDQAVDICINPRYRKQPGRHQRAEKNEERFHEGLASQTTMRPNRRSPAIAFESANSIRSTESSTFVELVTTAGQGSGLC